MNIDPRAKKCPYCQHWQNKWSMITFHPLFAMIPTMILFLVLFGFAGKMYQTSFSEGEPFSLHTSAVSVVESKMVFGVSSCEHESPTVVILGKIQNDSPVSWEDVKLEATFFDEDGNLIDATQERKYFFMVAAKDQGTFKLSFKREFPEEQYDSFKIRIISANDEGKRF
jgi:hypothetical protein